MSLAQDDNVVELIEIAKREDLGRGDLTAELLPDGDVPACFHLVAKMPGIFAGHEVAPMITALYDDSISIEWSTSGSDGSHFEHVPCRLATIRGPLQPILSAERVLLNFLQRLSGIATLTRAFVDAVAGTGADIYDTRKTTPGWRSLEKYAVRCGGGRNHRQGLYDAVLIKDNYCQGIDTTALPAFVGEMLNRLEAAGAQPAFIMVEADTVEQADALLTVAGIDVILVDNFSLKQMREAVALRDARHLRGKVALEASGGVNLETVRAIAETGVDRISIGAITHSATSLDLSMERV